MSDRLLTTVDAARYLNVSPASIRRWNDAGLLHASRIGNRRARRFREDELLRFLQASETKQLGESKQTAVSHLRIQDLVVPIGSHLVTLYGADGGRARLAYPFLRDGVLSGNACFVVATPGLREHYLRALRQRDVNVDDAIRSGTLVFLPVTPATAEERLASFEEAFTDAVGERGGPLRFVGEAVAGLNSVRSLRSFANLERGLGEMSKRYPIVMLCAYDCRAFSGTAILESFKWHADTFAHPIGYFLS
jgi:excisionase family DNA binding protein